MRHKLHISLIFLLLGVISIPLKLVSQNKYTVKIIQPDPIKYPTVTVIQPTYSLSTGSVVFDIFPKTGNWTFKITPGGTTIKGTSDCSTISGLTAGKYTYTITNESTCVSELSGNVIINTQPTIPVANAGPDQSVSEGTVVTLDGSKSNDADGDRITFKWAAPAGIILSSTTDPKPTFIAPKVTANTNYIFSLVVNDGKIDSPADEVTVQVKNNSARQEIKMNIGWNIISSDVVPTDLDLKNLFKTLIDAGKLKKVMDESGKTIENFGAFGSWKNNIGNLILSNGYKVDVNESSTLYLEGIPAQLPFDIKLNKGWNIISYPSENNQNAKALIQPLIDAGKLKKVMDESGKTIENFGVFGGWKNNIGNFQTGKGYEVDVLEDCNLTIPATINKVAVIVPEVLASAHFTKVFQGNGTGHMNIHLVNLQASGLLKDDEIGVFDGTLCVGSAMIGKEQLMDGNISIPASSNDELSENFDGFTSGHPVELQLFRGDKTYKLSLTKINGNELFEKYGSLFAQVNANELSIIQTTEDSNKLFKVFPNPTTGIINVDILQKADKKTEVLVTSLVGAEIYRKEISNATKFQIDLSDQVEGVYLLIFNNYDKQYIRKIVVSR